MKCLNHADREASGACVVCGRGVCPECQRETAGTVRCAAHMAPVVVRTEKSGFLTGMLSFFPGLGHIYLGAYQRGLTIMLIFAGLITIMSHGAGGLEPLFGLGIAFLWFFGIIDAVRICRAINSGVVEPIPSGGALLPAIPSSGARGGTLTLGVILIGIGCLIVADRYFDLERFFDFMQDNIGVILILLGGILLVAYSRRKKREQEPSSSNPTSILPPPSLPNSQS